MIPKFLEKSRKYPTSNVPEIQNELVDKLWEELKREKIKAQSTKTPPIQELDFDPKTLVLELKSRQVDLGSEYALESERGTLKTLLSYQGDYEEKSEARKLPSHHHGPTKTLVVGNLTNLLAAPIKCTLPLADILKVKPKLERRGEVSQENGD